MIGWWCLVVGYWLSVIGCRILVVGYWLSVVGSFGWKPIPSVARVTRDEVSGLKQRRGSCLEDSTLPVYAHRIFLCFGTVFQTAFFVILYIPRLRPGLLSLRSVLASSQSYLQPTTKHQHNQSLYIFIY